MNTIMATLMMILACLSWGSRAQAADAAGNYAIWGSGNKSCYAYGNSRRAGNDRPFKDYVMGYLTAYNAVSEATYSISGAMNLAAVLAWLDAYCARQQVHGFEQALAGFIVAHHDRRQKTPPTAGGR